MFYLGVITKSIFHFNWNVQIVTSSELIIKLYLIVSLNLPDHFPKPRHWIMLSCVILKFDHLSLVYSHNSSYIICLLIVMLGIGNLPKLVNSIYDNFTNSVLAECKVSPLMHNRLVQNVTNIFYVFACQKIVTWIQLVKFY